MKENTVVAVAWIAVTIMVLGVAGCAFGVASSHDRSDAEMATKCWDIGGSWETGWNGKWCNRNPTI